MPKLDDVATCSICLDLFKTPKRLPGCSHSFCLRCLRPLAEKRKTFKCPECREKTVVPPGGVKKLPTDLKLTSIVEEVERKRGGIKYVTEINELNTKTTVSKENSGSELLTELKNFKKSVKDCPFRINPWRKALANMEKTKRSINQSLDCLSNAVALKRSDLIGNLRPQEHFIRDIVTKYDELKEAHTFIDSSMETIKEGDPNVQAIKEELASLRKNKIYFDQLKCTVPKIVFDPEEINELVEDLMDVEVELSV